jgi:cytochrome c-type biogenesis protein CcsB
VLDMSFRPEAYRDRNLIKIRNVPLREDFRLLDSISDSEKERIVHDGLISLTLWQSEPVQQLMRQLDAQAVKKHEAINQIYNAAGTLASICRPNPDYLPAAIIAPATANEDDHRWHAMPEIMGNIPSVVVHIKEQGKQPPAPLPNYDNRVELLSKIDDAMFKLVGVWRAEDAKSVNEQAALIATLLPQVNPAVYPSEAKRQVEVTYNHLMKLTIPGAAFYFAAFVCFLMSANAGVGRIRLWGIRLFAVAFLIHTLGIAIRWWLVGSIPIKNQFESVLFSAWFGAAVGLGLELWRSRAIFGAAASFVGWLSLIAIFTTPFVAGRDIGGEIGQVAGVLMSYWLYIHVTLVTASYALIGMGFALGVWWLIKYYIEYGTLARVPARQLSADGIKGGFEALPSVGGGAASLGFARTIADVLFFPRTRAVGVHTSVTASSARGEELTKGKAFLATLDLCNLVVLQLAFWVLGVGIICGAIWADQSWGRPWGWDPKETFALVTWIVYLVVVHVRVATEDKAWWTAVLSTIGFFVMLFNWIGVNFFLVGLHSYA